MAKGLRANGLRIAKARQGLPGSPNQREFADRLGIHWVTQSNIENGKAKVSLELLERISRETGRTRDYLLGSDDEDEEPSLSFLAHDDVLDALDFAIRAAREKKRLEAARVV